jgi:hypothetical protein
VGHGHGLALHETEKAGKLAADIAGTPGGFAWLAACLGLISRAALNEGNEGSSVFIVTAVGDQVTIVQLVTFNSFRTRNFRWLRPCEYRCLSGIVRAFNEHRNYAPHKKGAGHQPLFYVC